MYGQHIIHEQAPQLTHEVCQRGAMTGCLTEMFSVGFPGLRDDLCSLSSLEDWAQLDQAAVTPNERLQLAGYRLLHSVAAMIRVFACMIDVRHRLRLTVPVPAE